MSAEGPEKKKLFLKYSEARLHHGGSVMILTMLYCVAWNISDVNSTFKCLSDSHQQYLISDKRVVSYFALFLFLKFTLIIITTDFLSKPPRPSWSLSSLLLACFPSQAAEFLLLDADVGETRSGCFFSASLPLLNMFLQKKEHPRILFVPGTSEFRALIVKWEIQHFRKAQRTWCCFRLTDDSMFYIFTRCDINICRFSSVTNWKMRLSFSCFCVYNKAQVTNSIVCVPAADATCRYKRQLLQEQ